MDFLCKYTFKAGPLIPFSSRLLPLNPFYVEILKLS